MKKLITYQIDSFTKERFKGNPAGVVLNADGLSEKQMQLIARELNNSETAFLFTDASHSSDGIIRYFTPQKEVPICGHATIAAMYARALEEGLGSCILNYRTQIGTLPFEIVKENGDYQIVMTQGEFKLNEELSAHTTQKLMTALGLQAADLDGRCPVQVASTGHSKVMVGIKSRQTLNSLHPNFEELRSLSQLLGCNGYFAFTFDSDSSNILTYGRMFAPAIGINEDPVTGNANGPLGGYLVQNRIVSVAGNLFEFNGAQGEQMDRLGVVNVRVRVENGSPVLIQVKGRARVVFRTTIDI
ncbi:MAG: PhzF family isomerase [Imperialibacter sp.]